MGIVSSSIGNRREVLKLRGLLKHTENVVQDLHDELEMKDSVTVKEIANEKYESGETYDDSFHDRGSSSVEQNFDNSKRCYGGESYYDKVGESSESMSQIEAELGAELERLGLNMNGSNLDRKLSDLDEVTHYLTTHCFICTFLVTSLNFVLSCHIGVVIASFIDNGSAVY